MELDIVDLQIGARKIGAGQSCFIIAEVGLAHDGSLLQAHAYIDAIAKAGADAAKFQCHLGDPGTEWRIEPRWAQDEDRQAYWKRTGFTRWEWERLACHSAQAGLTFLCSPFSVEAVRMLDPLVEAWKVPSGKVTDRALLDAVGLTGKPVLLSTGMATCSEVRYAVERLTVVKGVRVGVLQCSTVYPCPAEQIGLSEIRYKAEWGYSVDGLSDHSGTIYPGIAAAALGCQVLEVHVCFSRDAGGFDAAASLTMTELADLVRGVRFVEKAMRPVDKDAVAEQLSETRRVFMGVNA